MNDPLDITTVVLARLSELLRCLSPELIAELYAGTATLEVIPKAGRPVKTAAKRAIAKPTQTVDAGRVGQDLARIDDRPAATRYIEDLSLSADGLRALAKELTVVVTSKTTKPQTVHAIVEWTVGRRLDSLAVSRPTTSAF